MFRTGYSAISSQGEFPRAGEWVGRYGENRKRKKKRQINKKRIQREDVCWPVLVVYVWVCAREMMPRKDDKQKETEREEDKKIKEKRKTRAKR